MTSWSRSAEPQADLDDQQRRLGGASLPLGGQRHSFQGGAAQTMAAEPARGADHEVEQAVGVLLEGGHSTPVPVEVGRVLAVEYVVGEAK